MSHVRYPEDLFKVQRELLGRYHVTDPDSFYQNNDAWSVPNDPTVSEAVKQPPFYMSLQMPDQDKPAFQLTSSFIPQTVNGSARNILYGFLAADSDAGNAEGRQGRELRKTRLLELPTETQVPGPGQAQNKFNSDPTVSQALNLLRQGASDVLNGNLLTLPVGGGLLYVQPVYLKSTGETSYPTLQRVLVAFGDKIGFAPTLDEALEPAVRWQLRCYGRRLGQQRPDAASATGHHHAAAGGTDAKADLKAALEEANKLSRLARQHWPRATLPPTASSRRSCMRLCKKAIDAETKLGAATERPTPAPTAARRSCDAVAYSQQLTRQQASDSLPGPRPAARSARTGRPAFAVDTTAGPRPFWRSGLQRRRSRCLDLVCQFTGGNVVLATRGGAVR